MENKARGIGRVYSHGKSWWIDVTFKGKRRRERVASLSLGAKGKKLAEAVLAKRSVEISENKFLDVKRDCKVTFSELSERYLAWAKENHYAYKTTDVSYVKTLVSYFGNTLISEVSKEDVSRYRNKRKEEVGPYTVNHELGCLRQMFNLAIDEWGHPQDKMQPLFSGANPASKFNRVEEKTRDRVLGKGELIQLLSRLNEKISTEKTPTRKDHQRLLDFILLAVTTGMRRGEIQGLKFGSKDIYLSELDASENHVVLRDTKNGQDRRVPLNRISSLILSKAFDFDYDPKRAFKKLCEDAGITGLRFHDLRRTFATYLLSVGTDPFTIAALLGHQLPGFKVTSIYARAQQETMVTAVKKLENYLIEAVPSGFYGTGQAHEPKEEIYELSQPLIK